jgi:hypothetical protein
LRHSTTFIGDGAIQWSDAIRQADSAARILGPPLLAGALGRLAVSQAASVAIDPAAVRPLYVRRPDAEIERDARGR